VPLLNSLAPKAKLIQVTSTTTKHTNKSFLSRLGGFFPHFSLGIEGRLWVGWVVSFSGFDCFLLLVVGGIGNKLGSTLLTLIPTPLKTTPNLYVDFIVLSSTQLKSSSMSFSLTTVLSR
jgi:hypothetical protein